MSRIDIQHRIMTGEVREAEPISIQERIMQSRLVEPVDQYLDPFQSENVPLASFATAKETTKSFLRGIVQQGGSILGVGSMLGMYQENFGRTAKHPLYEMAGGQTKRSFDRASRWLNEASERWFGTNEDYYVEQYGTMLENMQDPKWWVANAPQAIGQYAGPFAVGGVVRSAMLRAMPSGLNAAQRAAYVQMADLNAARAGFGVSVNEAMGGGYLQRRENLVQVHGIPVDVAEQVAGAVAPLEGLAIALLGKAAHFRVFNHLIGRDPSRARQLTTLALSTGTEVSQEIASIYADATAYYIATGDDQYRPSFSTLMDPDAVGRMIFAGVIGGGTPAVMIGGRNLADRIAKHQQAKVARRNFEAMPREILEQVVEQTGGEVNQIAREVLAERQAEPEAPPLREVTEADVADSATRKGVDTVEAFMQAEIEARLEINRGESLVDAAFLANMLIERKGMDYRAASELVIEGTPHDGADVRVMMNRLREDPDNAWKTFYRLREMEAYYRPLDPENVINRLNFGHLHMADFDAPRGMSDRARVQLKTNQMRQALGQLAKDIADTRQRLRQAQEARTRDSGEFDRLTLKLSALLEQEKGLTLQRDSLIALIEKMVRGRRPIGSDQTPVKTDPRVGDQLNSAEIGKILRLLQHNRIRTAARMEKALARLENIFNDAYQRNLRARAMVLARKIGRPSKENPRHPKWNSLQKFARAVATLGSRRTPVPFDGDSLIAAVQDTIGQQDGAMADYLAGIIREVELAMEAAVPGQTNLFDADMHAEALNAIRMMKRAAEREAKGVGTKEMRERNRIAGEFRKFLQDTFKVQENDPTKVPSGIRQFLGTFFGRTAFFFPRSMANYMFGPEAVKLMDQMNTGMVLRLGFMQKIRQQIADYADSINYDLSSERALASGAETATGVVKKFAFMRTDPQFIKVQGFDSNGNDIQIDLTMQELMTLWATYQTNPQLAIDGISSLKRTGQAIQFVRTDKNGEKVNIFDQILELRNKYRQESMLVDFVMNLIQSDVRVAYDQAMIEQFGFTNSIDQYFPTQRERIYNDKNEIIKPDEVGLGLTNMTEPVGGRMTNLPYMKNRVPANTGFVIGEFWRVFEDHAWKVASLKHVAPHLQRLNHAIDANEKTINAALGKRFTDYWTTFIKEVDREGVGGMMQTTPIDRAVAGIMRRTQAGTLSWHPAVSAYQPVSLMTAYAYRPELATALATSSELSYSEIVSGMPDLIDRGRAGGAALYNAYTQMGGSRSASVIARSDMTDIALYNIHAMDQAAIRTLAKAVAGHVERTMTDAPRAEKLAAVREQLRDVVNRTQPTYDIMNISGRNFQHRGNAAVKAIMGMFRSQLDKNMDVIANAIVKARRSGKASDYRAAMRTVLHASVIQSFVISMIRNLVRAGLIMAMGGFFDEDEFVNAIMQETIAGSVGIQPLIGDVASVAYFTAVGEGHRSRQMFQSPSLRVIENTSRSLFNIAEKVAEDDAEAIDFLKTFGATAQTLGLPGAPLIPMFIRAYEEANR